jgi:hypothetical protein
LPISIANQSLRDISRSTNYSSATADHILAQLLAGRSLTAICADPGMPPRRTIEQWVQDDRDGFAARYRRIRKIAGAKGGGPTVYTPELADWTLDGLMSGRSLSAVCREPGMPTPSTVRNWAKEDREGFAGRYRLAREIGYEMIADEIMDIADNCPTEVIERRRRDGTIKFVAVRGNVAHARQRIEVRQWWLSKMLPRRYGNRPNLLEKIERREMLGKSMQRTDQR